MSCSNAQPVELVRKNPNCTHSITVVTGKIAISVCIKSFFFFCLIDFAYHMTYLTMNVLEAA